MRVTQSVNFPEIVGHKCGSLYHTRGKTCAPGPALMDKLLTSIFRYFRNDEFPSSHHREETSELLRQSFFNLLEARRPKGTGGFSNCCSRQFNRMASDFSSSET